MNKMADKAKEMQKNERRKEMIGQYHNNKIQECEILLDNVWDPHNVAAILRSADGFGIEKVNLYYTYNKFPNLKVPDLKKKGKKSSSSANKWIKIENIKDLNIFIKEKKKQGFRIIGSDFNKDAKNLLDFKFPDKFIIVLGSESDGLSEEIRDFCDELVFIPMVGMIKSYNVSVSCAVLLYEIFKQKGKALKQRFEYLSS
jgi:tRNA (guanosine-2'-O-)-methyltransferase